MTSLTNNHKCSCWWAQFVQLTDNNRRLFHPQVRAIACWLRWHFLPLRHWKLNSCQGRRRVSLIQSTANDSFPGATIIAAICCQLVCDRPKMFLSLNPPQDFPLFLPVCVLKRGQEVALLAGRRRFIPFRVQGWGETKGNNEGVKGTKKVFGASRRASERDNRCRKKKQRQQNEKSRRRGEHWWRHDV